MSSPERRMELIKIGGLAEVALRFCEEELDRVKESRLTIAMGEYRGGKSSPERFAGLVASLCALEDLRTALRQRIVAKNMAEKENHDDRPQHI